MDSSPYILRYLPLFYDELENKAVYIAETLKNSKAANDLLDAVEKAILERLPVAEPFEKYMSKKDRKYPYYRIYIDNFIIYYVVIDDESSDKIMEVRRFIYKGQNQEKTV